MTGKPEELDLSKRSPKSMSSQRIRPRAQGTGCLAPRRRSAEADIEIRIPEGHEGEMLADLQGQGL
ncbi:hypothetical protein [Nocardia asiatica]|uniref:hypothetical protein n=1 Tax=Nocardia asiatica TaxID=209252 RepID=UPI002454142D|nr:hypothetical protein [Nocardia asiatica]